MKNKDCRILIEKKGQEEKIEVEGVGMNLMSQLTFAMDKSDALRKVLYEAVKMHKAWIKSDHKKAMDEMIKMKGS